MRTRYRRARRNRLWGLLKTVYMIVFVLSLLVVVGYLIFRLAVGAPNVEDEVVVPPQPGASQSGGQGQGENPAPTPTPIVLTRREGVYTCLLAGADDGNGKTDTIMLGVFDTKAKTASLVSVPRDTLVSINGRNHKINAAYGLGGMELLCETVEEMLVVPVDFYVLVELEAFSAIVNEIGGIWFDVPMDMNYEDPYQDLVIHVQKGYQRLNGEQALGVMRFREGYASQDLGRVQTQRALLTAMVKQTITVSNADKVGALMKILNRYVKSDMPLNDMIYFGTQAIGMNLDSALTSATLPNEWISPYIELVDAGVLELVNSLGIYEEPVPAEALNIRHK